MFILDIPTFDFEVGVLMNHEVDLINLFCVLSEKNILGGFGVKKFAYLGTFVFCLKKLFLGGFGVKKFAYLEFFWVLEN